MVAPLLLTKLYVPPARPEWVVRPRLIERLNAGLRNKLTLISAPAGYGKTTLLSSWLAQNEIQVGWVSVDEGDNDPARFWTYLIAALQTVKADLSGTLTAMLQSPQPPAIETILTLLINELTAIPQDFVLVLDDYHLVRAPSVHQQLTFLLEHLPPPPSGGLHLILATREDPPLPLARWRARGHIIEFRQADLVFSEQETADLLRERMQLEISPADVVALQRRTEGWIAGLHLAALSFRGHDDIHELVQSFAGSHRYILDYLIEEVFQRQSPEVQDFLLKTAILDSFCTSLCDAVRFGEAPGPSSYHILMELDQANLFIVPLDQSRQWYRYHHLFADLLRQRLRTESASDLPSLLHKRASQWYEANDFPADAVRHALSGSDWKRASELILELDAIMLKRGEVTTLLEWFRALPEEVVQADSRLCNAYSWPLILTDQIDAAESYLARAEQSLEQQSQDSGLLGQIAVARAHIARGRGDGPRVIALSARALELLPQESLSERSIAAMNLGIAQWYSGRLDEAVRALEEAQRAAIGAENDYVRLTALVFLSRVEQARGKLHRASAAFREIVAQGGQVPIVALAHYELCKLHYEWNDLAVATDHAQHGIALSRRSASPEFEVQGHALLAQVEQAQDKTEAAIAALQAAGQLIERSGLTPVTRLHYLTHQILVCLAQEELDRAAIVAERAPALDQAGTFPGYLHLSVVQVRLYLAQQQREVAWGQLSKLHEMASRSGWQSIVVQVRALQALAAPAEEEALRCVRDALELAAPEGYIRTFVDLGQPMAELLSQVLQEQQQEHRASTQDAALAYARSLLAAFQVETASQDTPTRPILEAAQPLIESLSERELQVLLLLAEGQTRHEIAQALYVSVNTIKAHLKGIYGKLNVHNRREAVAKARELSLLS
ncbi:MAG: LuxR C-terminal-related transcriptional regulator [Anaerolineae bacterium]|nr:LuxR C-terminal-related transcriptional regulator [Anaerolineae bacterium]